MVGLILWYFFVGNRGDCGGWVIRVWYLKLSKLND